MIAGVWNIISKLLFKVLTIIVAIPVARGVGKLVEHGWTAIRPEDPQRDPRKRDTQMRDALTWAALTGVGAAATKLVTSKGAAEVWRAAIGTEPPAKKSKSKKKEATAIAASGPSA